MNKIEWFGELPSTWDVTRLKNVLIERNERNKPVKTDFILSLTNDRGVIPYSEKGAVGNNSKDDITGYKLAYPKDLVLNSMNVVIGSVGISKYFGCVSPVYYMLRPRNHEDPVEFYNYLFQTNEMQSALKGYGNGIMEIRMRIAMSKLNTFNLPIPSSQAQRKIVDRIRESENRIDQLIANQQQQIEKLKEYKQSLISEVVTKGLDPNVEFKESGIDWIEKIPSNWKLIPFKAVFNLNKGLSITKENLMDEGVPVINYGEIHSKYSFEFNPTVNQLKFVDWEIIKKVNSNVILNKGDFVFCDTSEDLEGSGNFTILNDEQLVAAGYHTIVAKTKIECDSRYLAYLFTSDYWRFQVRSRVYGIKLFSITQSILKSTTLLLPPLDEQLRISSFLDSKIDGFNRIIEILKEKNKNLEEYKKSLIYEYVTGKKEVS